jgi:hypothetical protein
MRITVNIDWTPEEARAFLGLPDVRPMQEQLLKDAQERWTANLRAMEPEALLWSWLRAPLNGVEQLQEMVHSQMSRAKQA